MMQPRWHSPLLVLAALLIGAAPPADVVIAPIRLPAVAKVDPRFQSYNVEMAEVVGGRFWAPYPAPGETPPATQTFAERAAQMFRKRAPLDLKGNRRLRTLAAALGPAYVRVGGGWANAAYFQDDDAPAAPPTPGFQSVLTRAQWAGVVDFAHFTDSRIVTSFAVSAGARDANGVWQAENARKLLAYTRKIGGSVYAVEAVNEPNLGAIGGSLPKGYDGPAFARDVAAFDNFVRRAAPDVKTVGPASTGEAGFQLFPKGPGLISTEALLSAEPRPRFDIFAYHFYGAASQRCAMLGPNVTVSPDQALSEAWLDRADTVFAYYKALHGRFAPGTPIWITEEGEAGCGGDRWAASFLDSFRYVDQLARMAKHGVAAVFHNTLAASDYALIDDATMEPRPSYWVALLWRQLMGETVLDAGQLRAGLHLYAQCLRGRSGGVALLAINLVKDHAATLAVPVAMQRYTLTADDLRGGTVKLNGTRLALVNDDRLPAINPVAESKGTIDLPPTSITFLALPGAANPACRAR